MKSLLPKVHNKGIIYCIHQIILPLPALWSKVNVLQMPAHSQQPLRVILKELKLNWGLTIVLFGKLNTFIQYFTRIISITLNTQTHSSFGNLHIRNGISCKGNTLVII